MKEIVLSGVFELQFLFIDLQIGVELFIKLQANFDLASQISLNIEHLNQSHRAQVLRSDVFQDYPIPIFKASNFLSDISKSPPLT
jgi:hypothetical protein